MTDLKRYLNRNLSLGSVAWERFETIVRGMDRAERVAGWLDAERQLAAWPTPGDDEEDSVGQAREHVERRLKQRMAVLNSQGERPDDLRSASLDERPPRFMPHDRDVPEKEVTWVRKNRLGDDDRMPWSQRPTSAGSVSHSFDCTDPTNRQQVATDGGTPEDTDT